MSIKSSSLFEDLGKPTLRGVRKCPKCGTFNGTRGFSCKNQDCNVVFLKTKERKRTITEAVKILSASPLLIYSVALENDDASRCFVHLPQIEGIESVQDPAEVKTIKRSAATCYAPGCLKPVEEIGTLYLNLHPCSHTELVVNCTLSGEALRFNETILKLLPISDPVKEEISMLLSKEEDQLVQRITKTSFVVKCAPDDIHPLGYLHLTLFETPKSRRFRTLCGCQRKLKKPAVLKEKQMCLHFYMCICAFAADEKLLVEFGSLVQSVLIAKSSMNLDLKMPEELNSSLNYAKCILIDALPFPTKKARTSNLTSSSLSIQECVLKALKKEDDLLCNKTALIDSEEVPITTSFEEWLASVTERINQTMHYQFNGKPDPLVFQVPQKFFDILQHRLSSGSRKRRLPNSIVGFSSKNALPLGAFSRYTWHITNILHVKRIFDTTLVPLEVTRSFIENKDGTFSSYQPIKAEEEDLAQNFRKTLNNLLIKPLELKTFLKVGKMTLDQKQLTPFIVEWIPDILPKTHVGEMTIKFEYGHERNGHIEHRFIAQSSTITVSSETSEQNMKKR